MEAWNSAGHAEKQHEQFIKNNKVQSSMERFAMNGRIDDMTKSPNYYS